MLQQGQVEGSLILNGGMLFYAWARQGLVSNDLEDKVLQMSW